MVIKGSEISFGDLVVVTLSDGKVYKGVFSDYEAPEDSLSGLEEMEIRDMLPSRTLYVPDIVSVERVA